MKKMQPQTNEQKTTEESIENNQKVVPKKKLFTKQSLLRKIILVFLSLIIGINIYLWNSTHLLGNDMPMPFGFGISVVLSGSMEPELSVNDVIIVKKSDSYDVGDIVVFRENRMQIVHRIISKSGTTVVTQGDANNAADDAIDEKKIKGKVTSHIPYLGALIRTIKTPIGIIIVLAIALLLMELSYKSENKKGKKKEDERLDEIRKEIERLKSEKKDNQ